MPNDLTKLRALFAKCCKGISAIGDETRQSILLALMEGPGEGMRVGAITEKTNLSRPAVSHHLKVLRDANIVTVNEIGTMNFYYLNPDKVVVTDMLNLCRGILDAMNECEVQNHESRFRKDQSRGYPTE